MGTAINLLGAFLVWDLIAASIIIGLLRIVAGWHEWHEDREISLLEDWWQL